MTTENKVGRPTKYRPEMCERVVELMRDGLSKVEVAADLDINVDTLNEYTKIHPDFSAAIKRGEDLSHAWWLKVGRQNLMTKDFSYTGWYMNMKNRHGWKDKVENTGSMTLRHEDALKEME